MPVRYDIEPRERIVRVIADGAVSYEDDRACLDALLRDPRHRPGFGILLDHRRRNPAATADHVRAMAAAFAASSDRLGAARLAFVVEREVSFGLARMFSALTHDLALEIEIYRSIEDAESWLAAGAQADDRR